jgi:hypothetical protein
MQQRRLALALVLDEGVAALAQRVPEQYRALREVERVFVARLPERPRRQQLGGLFLLLRFVDFANATGEAVLRDLEALLQQGAAFGGERDGLGEFVHGILMQSIDALWGEGGPLRLPL